MKFPPRELSVKNLGFDTGLRRVDRLRSSAREAEGWRMNANGLCRSAPCPSSARTAPVAIDDVDSFGRHRRRRLHEHFPRIISGRTTEEGSGEGEREVRSEHPTSFECPPHRERSHVLGNAHWRTTTQHETPLSLTAADKKSRRSGESRGLVWFAHVPNVHVEVKEVSTYKSHHEFNCHVLC